MTTYRKEPYFGRIQKEAREEKLRLFCVYIDSGVADTHDALERIRHDADILAGETSGGRISCIPCPNISGKQ